MRANARAAARRSDRNARHLVCAEEDSQRVHMTYPVNNGSKQSLHRCKKQLHESIWKQSESLTLEKVYVSFYLYCARAKKTIVAQLDV